MRPLKLRTEAETAESRSRDAAEVATYALSGHSGASVILHTRGADSFVRKTAASAAASLRLRAQARKQHKLWMMGVPVPKILRESEDEAGRAAFDMTYIPGRSLADAVIQAAPIEGERVVKAVERLIWLFLMERGAAIPESRFREKIDEVAALSRDRVTGPELAMIESCAGRLRERDWTGIPQSPCHGDLSLENVLLTAGKSVAFIDCDVPWISSFWLDFGKLFQDIHGHWCIRSLYGPGSAPARLPNAVQKLEHLGAQFRDLAAKLDQRLPLFLPQLSALGLYRTIPYARDTALVSFVCRRIDRILEA
jgi:tRNA A-37 threonylcarbamoyl transferase component Bud32